MLYLLCVLIDGGYDEYRAKLIRAKSVAEAREIANRHVGDEGRIWTDHTKVSCDIVKQSGPSGEIISDFVAGSHPSGGGTACRLKLRLSENASNSTSLVL